jgi:formate dehydrogenase subunit gamma
MSRFHARHIVAALIVSCALSAAGPTAAQQQPPQGAATQRQAPVLDPDADAVNQQMLLRQFPRIEGSIVIPDERASVLIQPAGRQWDWYHEVLLHWLGAAAILGMVAVLAAAYLIIGRLRISAGRSGVRVHRFSAFERFSHWLTAISFVTLTLTGLNVTFGKLVLRPLIGPEAFSSLAQGAKYVHNFFSVPFVIGLVLMVAMWIKDNIPRKVDVDWIREGGGFIRSRHPTAGRFNAGEKLVFWFALGAGAAVTVSGVLLLIPFYVTNIAGMQVAQVVHSMVAVLFIAVIIAHIYIGTLGMEGAFEAMRTGSVDLNWAKEHHGLWLDEERAKGHLPRQPPAVPAE